MAMTTYDRPPFEEFHGLLREAQHDRELLPIGFSRGHTTPYWNTWEMLTMMREVNVLRKNAGKLLVTWEEIQAAEQQACGHFDYTKKFALYCAELAVRNVGDNP